MDQESTHCIPPHIENGWKDLVLTSPLEPTTWDSAKCNLLLLIAQYLPNCPGKEGKAELHTESQELCFKRRNNRFELADM